MASKAPKPRTNQSEHHIGESSHLSHALSSVKPVVERNSHKLLLLAFAIIPYARLGFQGIILWDDLGFPPLAANLVSKKIWVWHSSTDDTANLHDIPYWGIVAMLQGLGPIEIVQRVWFVGTFWLIGVSMYFLAEALFPKASRWTYFFSGLFYMYNPVLATYQMVGGTRPWMIAYALSPFALAVLAKALRNSHVTKRSILTLTFLIVAISILTNVWELEAVTYFLLSYNGLRILAAGSLVRTKMLQSARIWISVAAGFISLSIFWLLPAFLELQLIYQNQYRTTGLITNTVTQIKATLGTQTPIDVFRLYTPSWDYGFQSFYSSNLGIILGLAVLVIASLAFLTKVRRRDEMTILAVCLGLFLVLASMTPELLLNTYAKIIDLVPYGRAVIPLDPKRYLLYCVSLGLAVLFGLGSGTLLEFFGKAKTLVSTRMVARTICVTALVGLVLFNAWPIVTGYSGTFTVPVSIQGQTQTYPIDWNMPASIPASYQQAASYIDSQPGAFNVFVLPSPNNLFYDDYSWIPHHGMIQSLAKTLWLSNLDKSVLFNMPNDPQQSLGILQVTEQAIYSNQTNELGKLLSVSGVKYLLFRTDIRNPTSWTPTATSSVDYQRTWKILNDQKDIILRATYGRLSIFENMESISKVYAAANALSVIGDQSLLVPISAILPPSASFAYYFPNGSNPSVMQLIVNSSAGVIVSDPIQKDALNLTLPLPRTIDLPTTFLSEYSILTFWTSTAYGKGQVGWPSLDVTSAAQLHLNETLGIREGPGNFSAWAISHPYKSFQDWSAFGEIFIYWKGSHTGQVFNVDIRTISNDDSNVFRANFWDTFDGWQRVNFPLPAFSALSGRPDWEKVTNIILRSENNVGGDWHMGPWFTSPNQGIIQNTLQSQEGLFGSNSTVTWVSSQLNPTTYQLSCNDRMNRSVFAVLDEPFHPYWIATELGLELQHFMINGASNGYLLGCNSGATITIEFKGTKLFDYSALVSVGALIVIMVDVSVGPLRKRKIFVIQIASRLFRKVKSAFRTR